MAGGALVTQDRGSPATAPVGAEEHAPTPRSAGRATRDWPDRRLTPPVAVPPIVNSAPARIPPFGLQLRESPSRRAPALGRSRGRPTHGGPDDLSLYQPLCRGWSPPRSDFLFPRLGLQSGFLHEAGDYGELDTGAPGWPFPPGP